MKKHYGHSLLIIVFLFSIFLVGMGGRPDAAKPEQAAKPASANASAPAPVAAGGPAEPEPVYISAVSIEDAEVIHGK